MSLWRVTLMTISGYEIERLQAQPLFSGLAMERIAQLLEDAVVRVHPKRQIVFEQGEPVTHFYVVLSGWVKIFRLRPDGTEVVMEIFGPGESFAEGAMHMPDGYPATAEMIEDGRLLEVPTRAFRDRLRQDPDLALSMLASMAIRLKRFVSRVEKIKSQSAPQRVADFLLKFIPLPNIDTPGIVVKLPYDKQLIANRLGMKPETFSRALSALKKEGVTVDGAEARIENLPALRRFIEPI
jgi:CRP-like cAMP-binding protein